MKRSWIIISLVTFVLLIDQTLKIYIKTHFEYGEEHRWADWAMLKFVENEGMAFGMTLGGIYGKLALSVFRLIAVTLLFFYIKRLLDTRAPMAFIACIALILAGALGNIFDSMFYGLIFSETPFHGGVANLVPFGTGYDEFLFGKVVDMLHFPIYNFVVPASVPLLGGQEFTFFSFIFNIADAAISTGVFSILLFQRKFFKEEEFVKYDQPIVIPPSIEPENSGNDAQDLDEDLDKTSEINPVI